MRRTAKIALMGFALVTIISAPAMSFQPAANDAQATTTENATSADEEASSESSGGDAAAFDAAMSLGEGLYAENCATCHGAEGTGPERAFPGNTNLEYPVVIASQVIHGGEFMPRFPELTDEEIAAIGTYIRNSWGNEMGLVTAEDIGQYR